MAKRGELPSSVQAGLPRLGPLPRGWEAAPLGKYIYEVKRQIKLKPSEQYRLVTVRRNRGGVDEREILFGRQIKSKTQFQIRHRDFLISKRQIAHGACAIVPEQMDGAVVSNDYSVLACRPGIDLDFLRILSNSVYFQQTCFHSSIGVHVEKLVFKIDRWLAWEFNFPPLEEQQRIACVVNVWDTAIKKANRMIAAMELRFAAFSINLLRGHERFSNDVSSWPKIFFKDVMQELVDRNSGRLGADDVMAVNKTHGMIPMKEHIRSEDLSRYKIVPPNSFAYNPMRLNIGSLAMNMHGREVLVSPDYVAFAAKEERLDCNFFDHLRRSSIWSDFVTSAGSGSVRIRIYYDHLSILPFLLPPIDVQARIADVLDKSKREIALLKREVELMEGQKRGLMQRLLSGDWRVPVRDGEVDAMAARLTEEAAQ
jgi:type I restriction enzyme, S subunit